MDIAYDPQNLAHVVGVGAKIVDFGIEHGRAYVCVEYEDDSRMTVEKHQDGWHVCNSYQTDCATATGMYD